MVRSHLQLNGHEFEQTPGVRDGQGGLACCSPWGCKELDMTERLNWTEPTSQNPLHWNLSQPRDAQATLEEHWIRTDWHKQDDQPETTQKANCNTVNPESVSCMAEQFSWFALPCCSLHKCSSQYILLFCQCVSLWIIHFWVLDRSLFSSPGRSPPSNNRSVCVSRSIVSDCLRSHGL